MAEGGSGSPPAEPSSGAEAGSGGPNMEEITAGLVAGQSKSKDCVFMKFSEIEEPSSEDGKNKLYLICQICKCKVLKPGFGTLVEREVSSFDVAVCS